ncbi:MAG: sugar-phosphate isomerase, RpiB/LacA/LacB family [Firmicutes bacterium]|nr:sugar-phosphate isomerase, RpiB/LacA/LacB family [Bacillota bacterium]
MERTIVIGSDHAGFLMKQYLIQNLKKLGFVIEDKGTYSEESADFSPIAQLVAETVAADENKQGILVCGTGIGMSIMANKIPGIRAALVHDLFSAKATREHNNTNVLCMGARIISTAMGWEIASVWLNTDFLGGKHAKRIQYITDYEKNKLR